MRIQLDDAVRRLRASDPDLTKADLLDESIGDKGVMMLAGALWANPTIITLCLSNNKIGCEGAAALAVALCTTSALTTLELFENKIGAKGAAALAGALRTNSTVTELGLSCNRIGDEGVVALADSLRSNYTLTVLRLDSNKIGDEGTKAIADALRTNSTLRKVYLGSNKIGDEGAAALGDTLCTNSTVTEVYLLSNEIGDKGAAALADAIRKNSTLNMLSLSSNNIGDEGGKALADALRTNCTLTDICLDSNEIGDGGATVLAGTLRQNFTITKLTLSHNKININLQKIYQFVQINRESSDPQEVFLRKAAKFKEGEWEGDVNVTGDTKRRGNAITGGKNEGGRAMTTGGIKGMTLASVARRVLMLNRMKRQQPPEPKWGAGPGVGMQQMDEVLAGFSLAGRSSAFREMLKENHLQEAQLLHDMKSYQKNCVADEGISYFISVGEKSVDTPFDDNCTDLDMGRVPQLVWNADRIRQAATGDGSALSGLLMALQWIVGKYIRKECPCEDDVLPPPPDEISLALKSPKARKELADRKIDENFEHSILHYVCAAEANCALQVSRILVEHLGAEFDNIKDTLGRSARTIALANNNPEMVAWARRVGTLLGRYKIDRGPPIHKSATCSVVSAIEFAEGSNEQCQVALKIVTESIHYEHELGIRLVHKPGSGVDISTELNRFHDVHALKLNRYHHEVDPHSDERVMCLVMPLADRSLDDIIRAENVAGRELFLIKHFAVAAARALHHLHSDHGIVHADFKPRNVVRLGSQFNLIDFNSSVRIGDPVGTGKVSTGYCPPELAKVIFSHEEDLEELKKQQDDLRVDLEGIKSPRGRAVIEQELNSIEERIALLGAGNTDPPIAHPTLDIWAFGVVMHYLLTGVCLFRCDIADNLVGSEEERRLVQWKGLCKDHLRSVLANCPGATGAEIRAAKDMLRKCLEPDPKDRPQSMSEILRMLFLDSSVKNDWTPGERNSIRFLFSDPLVYRDADGELCPIERLNFERERDLLVRCLKNVGKDIRLSFDAATVPRLQELADARCGCLHFTGHGHPSYLLFEDGSGGAHFLNIDELRKLIPRRDAFQFVFVGACDSQAIGQAFVDAGVPHVLCCEHESQLMDDAAAEFTRSFYCELAKGSTVKEAFDSGSGSVRVGHGGESESQKYILLPSDEDHSISIFDADDIEEFDEENKIETVLPAPADLEGCQNNIYEVVSEVFFDSGKVHFIYLVGGNYTLRRNLLSAACHYIKDRLSTVTNVDRLVYAKPSTVGIEDPGAYLLDSLYKQLIPNEQAPSKTSDSLESSICKALSRLKTLIVFDGVRDTGSLCGLLNSLCDVAGKVKVLLSAEKKPAFSCPAVETVLHVDNLGYS